MEETLLKKDISSQEAGADATIPEKFRDPDTGALNVDALLQSYIALEKKLSGMMPRPDSAEDRLAILRMLGLPESPDAYDITVPHGLFDVDGDVNKKLHEKGFTVDQVLAVYDLAAEKFVPMILELAGEFQADREVERLIAAFGGEDKWAEVSRQLLSYGRKNLPPEVLKSLAGSFEGVMALYRMMKGEGSEDALDLTRRDSRDGHEGQDDLTTMMRDPRYWRDRDPAFVGKVTKGFQKLYGAS